MNIYDIRNKAYEYKNNSRMLLMVMISIGLISMMCNLLKGVATGRLASLLTGILFVFTLALDHGIIVASMQTIYGMDESIDVQTTALTGFKRFRQLAPTYFLKYLVANLAGAIIGLIAGLILLAVVGVDNILLVFNDLSALLFAEGEIPTYLVEAFVESFFAVVPPALFITMMVLFTSAALVQTWVAYRLALVPYIIEKYGITGKAALQESSRLMKGNVWTYVRLHLSFVGKMILYILLMGFLSVFIGSGFAVGVGVVLEIALYGKELTICQAIFYEEIDLEDKNAMYEQEMC